MTFWFDKFVFYGSGPSGFLRRMIIKRANQRIIVAVATYLEVPPERIISNVANYGNTSAASIPLALDEAVRSDQAIPLQLQDLELV